MTLSVRAARPLFSPQCTGNVAGAVAANSTTYWAMAGPSGMLRHAPMALALPLHLPAALGSLSLAPKSNHLPKCKSHCYTIAHEKKL